jgi:DNA processing protein
MNIYDIWYGIAAISDNKKLEIIKKFNNTEKLWYYIVKNNYRYSDLDSKCINILRNSWDEENLSKIIRFFEEKEIKISTYYDGNYPDKLRYIQDPPFLLFYYGSLEHLNQRPSVSVVGSRDCTYYGINATKVITKELSLNNINIISGLARGIDSAAHTASLEANNYTCAVLGCGIDIIYPRENTKIFNQIKEKGCIITEFPPGTRPYSYNFPKRNRIISALSDIVIIVEAGERSGSLITANVALEQGKEVISVPGSVFSPQSKGTNKLIRDGAHPFCEIDDIFSILGMKIDRKSDNKSKKGNPKEETICQVIGVTPIHINDIIRITNIDIKEVYELLFEMQLRDEIMCISGNYYVKIGKDI